MLGRLTRTLTVTVTVTVTVTLPLPLPLTLARVNSSPHVSHRITLPG